MAYKGGRNTGGNVSMKLGRSARFKSLAPGIKSPAAAKWNNRRKISSTTSALPSVGRGRRSKKG